MGIMHVPSKTLCLTSMGCKWASLLFHRKRLEPRVLPWQQHSRSHSVSFVMYISGANFEDNCSNISGDILDSVFYSLSGATYDVVTFLVSMVQMVISLKWKRYCKKETPFFLTLKNLSNKQQSFFTSWALMFIVWSVL